MAEYTELHLEGLSIVEKRLVKAYATSIMGGVRTIESVQPEKLKPYVELEIAEREIAALT
ncbi:superfamily II helicase [Solibacillus silvestris StLB046]|uniref:Superfamily II helicase n=1 Tax=Solibacillus silvestris (strain StLB046) TaxID=1002809 RepID=F2F2M7_SOLSS|nr:hypothetical protein [Solibacillus silvestris]BAK15865.1 superfamily II helicase [Solibacillus silvestris StLB046]